MNPIPALDPIPLPAPVWLFKVLHIVTLSLHFVAVEMLLGGLLVAAWLNFLGRKSAGERDLTRLNASASLARRLPVVMTYVINLGVPPLLFAQVLYGRAIYTSSVLIGVWWISVVFLLMGCYWLLYRFAARAEAGRSGWGLAILAWLIAGAIAKIYSTNMTLMLRPEVWGSMYSASGLGLKLPPSDPTLMARWLFMLTGGLVVAGLWMIWLSARTTIEANVRSYLGGRGGLVAAGASLALAAAAYWVWSAQPEVVREGFGGSPLYQGAGFAWLGLLALALAVGLWNAAAQPANKSAAWLAALAGILAVASMTVCRDGIRDLTLASKGFALQGADMWQRAVHINWSVLVLFLVSFVAGLVALGWLISVIVRAKPVAEKINS